MTEDQSCALMTAKLYAKEPFFYLRYGDGALECIYGVGQRPFTCDRELYSPELGDELLACWDIAMHHPHLLLGDWRSAYFDEQRTGEYPDQYEALLRRGNGIQFLHYEALNLRSSVALIEFYRALRNDPRPKLYMGMECNQPLAAALKAEFLGVPLRKDLFSDIARYRDKLIEHPFSILLFGAGMAGATAVLRCAQEHPERTYIHVGAALDPAFRGKSRSRQVNAQQAREILKNLYYE